MVIVYSSIFTLTQIGILTNIQNTGYIKYFDNLIRERYIENGKKMNKHLMRKENHMGKYTYEKWSTILVLWGNVRFREMLN